MKNKKWAMVFMGLMIWSVAHADGKDFIMVGASKEYLYSIKKGTGHYITATDGKPAFGGIIREDAKDGRISYYKEYVSGKDCDVGYGTLYAYGLNGGFISGLDWVKGGGDVSSSIADFLCMALDGAKPSEKPTQ